MPTVVVVGAEDRYTPESEARVIAKGIPGAELVVIEEAAHLPPLEQPEAFDKALTTLLSRVERTG